MCFVDTDTDWAGGVYKVIMEFPAEYPVKVSHDDLE